ncbi:MAG: hypothetical protein J6Y60_03590 [Treponema sp.]|nr:hypothetical protein [Treponema sp.]
MANELENTVEATETDGQKTNDSPTIDIKDLQTRIKTLEAENGKLKQSVTNASADASKWKREYQAKLSAEEKASQEQAEQYAAMQAELTELRTRERVASHIGQLVAPEIGMDAETAKAVAEALNSGDTDAVFNGIRKFVITHDKALKESAIRNNPTLHGGKAGTAAVTKADFDKMGYREMVEFKTNFPELYDEYTRKK